MGPRFHIAKQLPGDAPAADPWTTLWVAKDCQTWDFPLWPMLSRHQFLWDWKLRWKCTALSLPQLPTIWSLSKSMPLNPFLYRIIPLPVLSSGERSWECTQCCQGGWAMPRPWFFCSGFNRLQKVKMDSISVLQRWEQETIYTRKTKH